MKLYKSLFIVAAIICGMMTSCSDDGYWDKATPAALGLTDGPAYAFNSKSLSYVYYPADVLEGTDINVTITRGTTSGNETLNIKAVFSDTEMISGPESVTFADGSNTASYPIHFDKEIGIGQSVTAKLAIDTTKVGIPVVKMPEDLKEGATAEDSAQFKADSTAYAVYQTKLSNYKLATTVNISKDYNWVSLGKGIMTENYWFENGEAPASVTIMQAVENKKIFRVVDPWSIIADAVGAGLNGNQTNLQFRLLEVGEALNDVAITQKDLVYFDQSNTGYHHSSYDADVWLIHPADFSNTGTEDKWLHNKVLSYQADGLPAVVQLAPRYYMFGVGGWNQSQADGILQIVFPGVKIYDYSAELSYVGLFTDPDGVISVWGDLKLGADAKTAKAVIISQDADPAAVADAIAAGELEATDVEAGRIELPMPADANGLLQIVVAVIDEGEAKNVATAKFEYYSGTNPWKSLGKGLYTDDLIYPLYTQGGPSATYEVEIEEHSETPGLYRLVDPYGASFPYYEYAASYSSATIVVHAEDPDAVYIPEQTTGLTLSSSDGLMSILTVGADYLDYYGDEAYEQLKAAGYFGTLKDGVMTFPSFAKKDDAGNVTYTYQGYVGFPDGYYYMGRNGEMKIVLPSAVTASARRAAHFATNLYKYSAKAKNAFKKSDVRQAKADKSFQRMAKQEMLKRTFERVK